MGGRLWRFGDGGGYYVGGIAIYCYVAAPLTELVFVCNEKQNYSSRVEMLARYN